ncbi:MAG: hypothetical protein LM577_05935 [Thermoproteaceae archaeon]|nr:hypothetical protein [Thermoproteaceae archaeon]
MYAFVDSPFSPSGVTHLLRLHRPVGLDRELREIADVLRVAKEGNNNVLAVVVAPYGWGKSELLDEIEVLAKREGFGVIRTALSLAHDFKLELSHKRRDEPALVLIDEADEVSRLAAIYKLGALSNEKFMEAVQRLATCIRALLEPRSYRHVLGEPERFNKIAIIVALTPQLYYTILKNVVPDVFDVTSGRVYREVAIDARFPFWQYVEAVRQRLLAYSTAERLEKIHAGELDALSPFTLLDLAAIYRLARERGEPSPRFLMKLTARLFQLKREGRRLADLLREEGMTAELDGEILERAYSGMPFDGEAHYAKRVRIYRIPYDDKEALAVAKRFVEMRGRELDTRDPKSVSYEPYLYYSLLEGGRLYVYVIADEDLKLEEYAAGERYVVSDDVARLVGTTEAQLASAIAREYYQRLEDPLALLEEAAKLAGVEGIRLRLCCGFALWQNNMGVREAYIFASVDREDELREAAKILADTISAGTLGGYVVDCVSVLVVSRVLLTDALRDALQPLLSAYWKRLYPEPASSFVTLQLYGADRIERLKHELVRCAIDRALRRSPRAPEFADAIRLGRERAKESIMKYTLALKRGKERKQLALVKIAEMLDGGQEVEGFRAYRHVEEILLNAFDESIHERELKSLIDTLLPVNLWRELREDDLIEIMKLRGVLVPAGDVLYKYRDDVARRHLAELLKQLEALSTVEVVRETPLGTIKLSRRITEASPQLPPFGDRRAYARVLRDITKRLLELRERREEVERELAREADERARLLSRLSAALARYRKRVKFLDLSRVTESDVAREEALARKAEEALRLWSEIGHMARALGSRVDVVRDLELLTELPQPWLDDYLANLKLYASEISRRHAALLEAERARKRALEWLRQRLNITESDVESAINIAAARLGVSPELLKAVARRGPGALLDIEELAREAALDRERVEEYMERLHRAGAVKKAYIA